MPRTDLYRHFDADGDLLYVGISLSAVSRLQQHRNHAAWASKIANMTVQSYPSRELAVEAEKSAIQREKPRFNVVHNEPRAKTYRIPPEFDLTYIEQGHIVLEAMVEDVEGDRYRVSFSPVDEIYIHSSTTYQMFSSYYWNIVSDMNKKALAWYEKHDGLHGEGFEELCAERFPAALEMQVPILQQTLLSSCKNRDCHELTYAFECQ